jgi:hypothetical protein
MERVSKAAYFFTALRLIANRKAIAVRVSPFAFAATIAVA